MKGSGGYNGKESSGIDHDYDNGSWCVWLSRRERQGKYDHIGVIIPTPYVIGGYAVYEIHLSDAIRGGMSRYVMYWLIYF